MVILFRPYLLKETKESINSEQCNQENNENRKDNTYRISPVQCKWIGCEQFFDNLDLLSNHLSKEHSSPGNGGLFYCNWNNCNRGSRGFNARYKMLVHVRTHTNEKPHQCYQCNKSFSRAENLKIHCRSHTGERPYICGVSGCGKAYSNSSDRFKHSRTHTIEKPYACKVPGCSKRYTDPSSLRKHVKTYKHYENSCLKDKQQTPDTTDVSNEQIFSKLQANEEFLHPYSNQQVEDSEHDRPNLLSPNDMVKECELNYSSSNDLIHPEYKYNRTFEYLPQVPQQLIFHSWCQNQQNIFPFHLSPIYYHEPLNTTHDNILLHSTTNEDTEPLDLTTTSK